MFTKRLLYEPSRLAVVFLLCFVTVSAEDGFNREICYRKVNSMLENGTLSINDTIFYQGHGQSSMSTPENPILTLDGCYEMCGSKFGWNKDIGPRLSTWLIPVFLLLSNMEVSPLDKRRYLMILHLLGDPIDSLWSLLTKLEAWSRCHHLAQKLCRSREDIRVRNVATVLGGIEDLVGFYDDPAAVFTKIQIQSKVRGDEFKRLTARAALQLADSRTDERLRTMLATTLYVYQIISAFVSTIGGGNITPPGGRIGVTMFMTWIIPSILLSNAIGGFTSRRTCYNVLEIFIEETTGQQDAWFVLQQAAPSLRRHRTVHDYLDTLAWSGAIYSYRPLKTIAFTSCRRDSSHELLLFLAALPIITSSVIASIILWNTPPIAINCRNILIFVMAGLMLVSTLFTSVSTVFFKGSRHWYVMLMKDAVLAIPSIILVFLACVGRFNSCWCWSGVFSLGARARIPLNATPDFVKYNKTIYPILVGICLTLQILAFVVMMWVGWKGWNIMRWSEEEKKEEWRASRRPIDVSELSIMSSMKSATMIRIKDVHGIDTE